MKIEVLDHGFVRLVSYMQPAESADGWTGDLEVVRNARVSYNSDWRAGDESGDAKLIGYLSRNRHTSPFEAMTFTFEVKAPIFVLRQWHRHRTWAYNEISARYTELDEGFYVPDPATIGSQSKSNKQMRVVTGEEDIRDAQLSAYQIKATCEAAQTVYRSLIVAGVPRELARSVLPVSMYSRMFATVNLHNLMHFLRLRLHAHAQYEIRVYAEALMALTEKVCPVSISEFKKTL